MSRRPARPVVAALLLAVAMLAACGSDDDSSTSAASSTTTYAPAIDPSSFTAEVTNEYFPLVPGTVFVYEGTEDGEAQRNEVIVTRDTKIVDGVTCVVVHDVVYVAGKVAEDTYDWYAQDADGTVWYFGEDTKELSSDGSTKSTAGSWESGVDGAQPGIVMPAHPRVGQAYRQEYLKGEAEDMATVVETDATVTAGMGTYEHAVVTEERTPLEPDIVEQKRFAPGIGFVSSDLTKGGRESFELVRIEHR